MTKQVYFFGAGKADGHAGMKKELGGKGANLAEMTLIGLPVPAGFTISTPVCLYFLDHHEEYPPLLKHELTEALKQTESVMSASFASEINPLLVSVRSGSAVSMPGMMDTILNLGLNDKTVLGLAAKTQNPRFAFDCYRRFIHMFSTVVKGLGHHLFDDIFEALKHQKNIKEDSDLSAEDLSALCGNFKDIYLEQTGEIFPQDPHEQLWAAIGAVFKSWHSTRAKKYREIHGIPDDLGTAVNICSMVYGNMGNTSGTGVIFTRDPSTGENIFYGEYLLNAQGEDVVAGIRTPKPIIELKTELPKVYEELLNVRSTLENHYKDMQDIEFTIQNEKLYILQTRNGKRSVQAALKIAIDLVHESIITKKDGLMRVPAKDLDQLLHPMLDPKAKKQIIAKGLPASPGAATGRVVFTATEAEAWAAKGESVILVRDETSPEDIGGMHASKGFLTARGGMTSHAAVVARQMGKCCIAGCHALAINNTLKQMKVGNELILEGDWITIDGNTGDVILGKVETKKAELSVEFKRFMDWATEVRTLKVRANADTPSDAETARSFGAEGIGLCRTEHMFFAEDRLPLVRKMILSHQKNERLEALDALRPFQKQDFYEIMKSMDGLPVTIRLLDPPLHEFLPHTEQDMRSLSAEIGLPVEEIKLRSAKLHEHNPMLGHRGCRLGISHPEIYEMQVRAIVEATVELRLQGFSPLPEIMIPLVGIDKELEWLRRNLESTAKKFHNELCNQKNVVVAYEIPFGTMIEIPRAALTADKIAQHADFFSFGTNDLTQTTYGFSRDDSGSFLNNYKNREILDNDPFESLDTEGVGLLIQMATEKGRKTKKDLKVGICGEHGGEPKSIEFCQLQGLNYVSCSPFRIPIAILAAAQAHLKLGIV